MAGLLEGEIENTQIAREVGILVLDGSGSMDWPEDQTRPKAADNPSKADQLRDALSSPSSAQESLFARFKRGARVNETEFVTLIFDTWVEERLPLTAAKDIDLSQVHGKLNVLEGHGGQTNVLLALQEAQTRASRWRILPRLLQYTSRSYS